MNPYHIIESWNGTFAVVRGIEERVFISNHNSREAAERAIIRLRNKQRLRDRDLIGRRR